MIFETFVKQKGPPIETKGKGWWSDRANTMWFLGNIKVNIVCISTIIVCCIPNFHAKNASDNSLQWKDKTIRAC